MVRPFSLSAFRLAALLALAPAAPALAVPGGDIGTLEMGDYACELPGDASGPVGRRMPGWDFTVIGASSYRAEGRAGSYLLTGDMLVMTSGPRDGLHFRREGRGLLRLVNAMDELAGLRCILIRDAAG